MPEFGFLGPDTTKIMLGELPGMLTPQFCRYATEAIITALSSADAVLKEEVRRAIMESVEWLSQVNAGKKVRDTQNPLNLPKQQVIGVIGTQQFSNEITIRQVEAPRTFWNEIIQAVSERDENRIDQLMEEYNLAVNTSQGDTTDYPENPFRVEGTNIVIGGGMYVVDCTVFARFATSCIGGGLFGWDSRGVPDYAYENLQILKQAL